jgi:hypothetical protein
MNLSLITTVAHNVGDDFVREGILYFQKRIYKNMDIQLINKHIPVSVRKGYENIDNRIKSIIYDLMPLNTKEDKILTSDLLIQSGAPVYYCFASNTDFISRQNILTRMLYKYFNIGLHCSNNEWYSSLIKKRYIKVKRKVKFLNIAAGTCQHYHSDGTEIINCKNCTDYINELYSLCKITTVRDELSKNILKSLGLNTHLLPCTSIFAKDSLDIKRENDEGYIALNYMRGGGHYVFSSDIDVKKWEKTFKRFYEDTKKYYRYICVCHNDAELKEVKRLCPDVETFYSDKYEDYLRCYSKARCGIFNRIHAAFALASFGVPSFVVGNDTRVRMVKEIELDHVYLADASSELLSSKLEEVLKMTDRYYDTFYEIRKKAFESYNEIFESI